MPPFSDASSKIDQHQDVLSSVELQNSATSKRSVSFDSNIRVNVTLNRELYSNQERRATWYDHHDFKKMIQESNNVLRRFQKESSLYTDCLRGLECMTKGPRRQRKINTLSISRFFVFREQQLQRDAAEKMDPDRIRDLYHRVATESLEAALETARFDAEAADLYQAESSKDHSDDRLTCCWFKPLLWFSSNSPAFVDSSSLSPTL